LANFWAALARRDTSSYAEWASRPAVKVHRRGGRSRKSVEPNENGHYAAISNSYHGTFEYRLFAGAVTGLQAQSAVEVVEWAHEMFSMTGVRKIVSVKKMLRNLAMNADKYPALIGRFEISRDKLNPYKEALAAEMASLKMKKTPRVPRGAKEVFVPDLNQEMRAFRAEATKPIYVSWNDVRDLRGESAIYKYQCVVDSRRDAELLNMFPWASSKMHKYRYTYILTDFPSDMTREQLINVFAITRNMPTTTRLINYFDWSVIWNEAVDGPIRCDSINSCIHQHMTNAYFRTELTERKRNLAAASNDPQSTRFFDTFRRDLD
jgi:hypothetical protein